jgi:hypothetical protein
MIMRILPRISEIEIPVRYIVFDGKQDLDKQIVRKLRKYNNSEAIFFILRDQDSANCKNVKSNLIQKCQEANKRQAVVRIACRELESWYLADLKAVELAFSKSKLSARQNEKKYRNPDTLGSPSGELKLLVPEYQKINGSRMIAPHLNLENSRSRSFCHFINSIRSTIKSQFSQDDMESAKSGE